MKINKYKSKICILIAAVLLLSAVTCGCGGAAEKESRLSVVVTVFPIYDWVKNIVGQNSDGIEITYLASNGADIHNYEPTVKDMIKITEADIFVCIGGESEKWVDGVLAQGKNGKRVVIKLLDALDGFLKEETFIEGMTGEAETEKVFDEHIWLSLRVAGKACEVITDELSRALPDEKESFSENSKKYLSELNALDNGFATALEHSEYDTLIFADRFPFIYFVSDYSIKYYAAFSGCSAETEASSETILYLSRKLSETGVKTLLKLEDGKDKLAQTVIKESDVDDKASVGIAGVNSFQSVSSKVIEEGLTYTGGMRENLRVFAQALGTEFAVIK